MLLREIPPRSWRASVIEYSARSFMAHPVVAKGTGDAPTAAWDGGSHRFNSEHQSNWALQDRIGRVSIVFAHKLKYFERGKTAKLFGRAGLHRYAPGNPNYCGSLSAGVLLVRVEPDIA